MHVWKIVKKMSEYAEYSATGKPTKIFVYEIEPINLAGRMKTSFLSVENFSTGSPLTEDEKSVFPCCLRPATPLEVLEARKMSPTAFERPSTILMPFNAGFNSGVYFQPFINTEGGQDSVKLFYDMNYEPPRITIDPCEATEDEQWDSAKKSLEELANQRKLRRKERKKISKKQLLFAPVFVFPVSLIFITSTVVCLFCSQWFFKFRLFEEFLFVGGTVIPISIVYELITIKKRLIKLKEKRRLKKESKETPDGKE